MEAGKKYLKEKFFALVQQRRYSDFRGNAEKDYILP